MGGGKPAPALTFALAARVAKLVDVPDLGSGAARHGGSSPSTRTLNEVIAFNIFIVGAYALDSKNHIAIF